MPLTVSVMGIVRGMSGTSRAPRRQLEGLACEVTGELATELGRAVEIGARVSGGRRLSGRLLERGPLGRLAHEYSFGGVGPNGGRADAAEGDPSALTATRAVQREQARHADQRKVSGPPRHLHEGAARARWRGRKTDLGQQLTGLQSGRERAE